MKHFIYIEAGEGGWYTEEYSFKDDNYNFKILGWMAKPCKKQDLQLVNWCKTAEIGDYFEHRLGVCVRVNKTV